MSNDIDHVDALMGGIVVTLIGGFTLFCLIAIIVRALNHPYLTKLTIIGITGFLTISYIVGRIMKRSNV